MKGTGIIRKVDSLGRIVIPKELRDSYGIEENTNLEIFTEGKRIILSVYNCNCSICDEYFEDMPLINGQYYCKECIKNMYDSVYSNQKNDSNIVAI